MSCSHPFIEEYFQLIDSGELRVCKEQLQLKSFLQEKVLNRDDVYLDEKMINDSVEIPGRYFPYKLYPWEKFVNVFVFGLRWKESRELVFNRYFLYMGRGAGKNGFIAWDSFFMTTKNHGIKNYDVEIVATSEDQAKQSFDDVSDMLEEPQNKKRLKNAFKWTAKLIRNLATKSKIKYNTSNARTKDGKRPGCVVFDEEHEYDDYDSIKVFTSGGGKKKDYREFHTSTDGYIRGGPLDDLKEQARRILNGEVSLEEITLFPFICRLDDPKEVDDPELWTKANPSLPYNSTLRKKMKDEFILGKINAQIRIEFMTKRMNWPIEDTRFEVASYEDRLATNQPIPEHFGKDSEVVAAIDFADRRDFASVGILGKADGKTVWLQHTFIYHTAIELQNINRDIVNIAVERGLAEFVYGRNIGAEKIVKWLLEQSETYYISKVAMDEYRSKIVGEAVREAGFEVEVVRRGKITHSKLAELVDELFIQRNLVFGDDPLMRWFVGNVYIDYLSNGNKEYKKIEAERRKTDGFFAFLHALNFYEDLPENDGNELGDFTIDTIVV